MSVEVFSDTIRRIPPEYLLISIAFIGSLWHKLKELRTGDPNDPTLEIDHITPRYRGGTDDEENLQALTKPEHAMKHHLAAENERNKKYKDYERTATGAIVARMSREEYLEFLKMVHK